MKARRAILKMGKLALVALVADCLSSQRETSVPLSLIVRAAAPRRDAEVVAAL